MIVFIEVINIENLCLLTKIITINAKMAEHKNDLGKSKKKFGNSETMY